MNHEPKPLSSEDRNDIKWLLAEKPARLTATELSRATGLIYALIAAEQYWREVVKNAKPSISGEINDYGGPSFNWPTCPFCEDDSDFKDKYHRPNCPWVAAQ